MSRVKWDEVGERLYETGVDMGVVYPMKDKAYPKGAPWNGLTAVNEQPSGAEVTKLWANNSQYGSLVSAEELGGTIEAYTYPDEFAECDGTKTVVKGTKIGQQKRKPFGMTYRSLIGNDTEDLDYGYKLHLLYGCRVTPSEKSHSTVNDSPEAGTFSWTLTTTPVNINTIDPLTEKPYGKTASIEIDSTNFKTTAEKAKLKALEDILYGTDGAYIATSDSSFVSGTTYYELVNGSYVETSDAEMDSEKTYYVLGAGTDARLPLPDEVFALLGEAG